MHGTTEHKRGLAAAFRSPLGALLASSPGITSSASAADEPPLVLAKASYFFVGGKIDPSVEGSPMVGQMYVEYMIPQTLRHPYPVIMVHGGSQTGTNFTGTPDGREGWAQYFVRRGYAVYVVDQVARGRAAHWSQSHGAVAAVAPELRRAAFRRARALQAVAAGASAQSVAGRRQARRSGLRSVLRVAVPLDRDFPKQQELNRDALAGAARQDRPGDPADPFAIRRVRLAGRRRAAEPCQGDRRGRAERPAGARHRVQGRAGMVRGRRPQQALGPWRCAAHLRSAARRGGQKLEFVRQDKPDKPDLARCWLQKEPARKLPNLAKMPILIVIIGSVLSRALRSLHRGLSDPGRRESPDPASPTSASTATAT